MQRIFQTFVDQLWDSKSKAELQASMADAAAALDLNCFAYLSVPNQPNAEPQLISTYPAKWTAHYLRNHYERLDPVIAAVLSSPEPFEWGMDVESKQLSKSQRQLFDEAAESGIRCGFTIPIHDNKGPIAAVTFAANERRPIFEKCINENARVLQLMAMYFHAHVRRKVVSERLVDGVSLSPREFECLEWAAQGKSAWETGRILGISRHTTAFHLDNAKMKLGVCSTIQAVARLAASKPMIR
jgi:LuxR family transcriptional regulator, activator of conjugal transfer of Ti plasmids